MVTMTRILSIDGGGIRGLVPATVLAEIERRTGRHVAELFDVIAGTSTGGILACGLTLPGDGAHRRAPPRSWCGCTSTTGRRSPRMSSWGRCARSSTRNTRTRGSRVLRHYMGDALLSGCVTDVLVTAYDIERRRPFFFRSARARVDRSYDFPLWMVARSTSAAPSYFEPFLLPAEPPEGHYALVDGGSSPTTPRCAPTSTPTPGGRAPARS